MRNILKIIAILIIINFIGSCRPNAFRYYVKRPLFNPDEFTLNEDHGDPIEGIKISGLESVEQVGYNALLMNEGGIAAMERNKLTQFTADFTVKVMQGDGIRFSIRNISDHPENHPAINFDYMPKGSMISGTGMSDLFVDSVKAEMNKPARVKILNLGKIITITVNCDTVYNGKTELPATEYIVVGSLRNSKVLLTGIDFIDENKTE